MPNPLPPPTFSIAARGKLKGFQPYHQMARDPDTGKFIRPRHAMLGKYPKPSDPAKNDATMGFEAMVNANALWRSLNNQQRKTWEPLAKRQGLPLRQAFLSVNLRNVFQHKPLTPTPTESE
jgi:hypothetical protein